MIPNEFDLKDKTIIISGASRGLGKGIVRVFAEAGAKVLVTALTDKYLGPLAEELAAAGHPIETMTSDATREDEWQRIIETAIDKWGHIDVLVNTLGDAVAKPVLPRPGTARSSISVHGSFVRPCRDIQSGQPPKQRSTN